MGYQNQDKNNNNGIGITKNIVCASFPAQHSLRRGGRRHLAAWRPALPGLHLAASGRPGPRAAGAGLCVLLKTSHTGEVTTAEEGRHQPGGSASFHKEKVKILSHVFQILLKSVWICNSLQKLLSMTVNTTAYSLYPWQSPEKNIKNTYWFSWRCLNLSKRNHSFHSHPIPCFLLHPLHLAQVFH